MGILDSIQQLIGGGAAKSVAPASYGFRRNLVITDGDAPYDTAAEVFALSTAGAVGSFVPIWELTVPAQQKMRWGYGSPAQPANQGYIWFMLNDTGTAFTTGSLRLVQQNANRTKKLVVAEFDAATLHSADPTTTITARLLDHNSMNALPEKREFPMVGEDSKLTIEFNTATRGTEDAAAMSVPCTIYQ